MKKIFISIIFLCFWIAANADVVPRDNAAKVAQRFLSETGVQCIWDGSDPGVKKDAGGSEQVAAFYVFNGKDSWVIVAADDIATPILMHGEGTFDTQNIPDNMRERLKIIEYDINNARSLGSKATKKGAEQWAEALSGTEIEKEATTQKLLTTANWGQGDPFNLKCPYDEKEDGQSITGCVATAMAIVMRYHQWPEKGSGKTEAYTTRTDGISVPENDLNHEYHWNLMPTNSGSGWTKDEKDAVSQLIYDCGTMVEMDFQNSGSGAYSSKVAPALSEHMSYSAAANEVYRSRYSSSEWFTLLKNEIDNNRPIIYSGTNIISGGGHAFVCDGYNSNNEVHFNWGWSGSDNAWCAVDYLQATSDRIYSKDDAAILGIAPNKGGVDSGTAHISYFDITLSSGKIEVGSTFSLEVENVANPIQNKDFDGYIAIGLVSRNGAIKKIVSNQREMTLKTGYYYESWDFTSCKVDGVTPELGDRLALCYSEDGTNWKVASIRKYDSKGYTGEIGFYDIAMIEIPTVMEKLSTGKYRYYTKLLNGHKTPASVVWYLDGTNNDDDSMDLSTGTHTIKAKVTYSDGSTETIEKTVTVK